MYLGISQELYGIMDMLISACPWSDLNAETDQKIYY